MKRTGTILYLLIGSLAVGVSAWLNQSPDTPAVRVSSVHAALGDPVRVERVIRREGYDLLYDGSRHNPLWVQYHITKDDIEPRVERPSSFHTDRSLPAAWRTYPDDFTNSGYDRGHMCASADQRRNHRVAEESQLTSNICPQTPGLNRGTWRLLEAHVREIAQISDEAIIATGPIFDSTHCAIGFQDSILVPGGFWKAIAYRQNANWYVRFWVVGQNDAGLPLDRLIVPQSVCEQLCGFELFPLLNIPAETKRQLSLLQQQPPAAFAAQLPRGVERHTPRIFDSSRPCVAPVISRATGATQRPTYFSGYGVSTTLGVRELETRIHLTNIPGQEL